MYISTRSTFSVPASLAIIKGIAPDGGLFMPEEIPHLDFNQKWLDFSYQEMARIIFKSLLDDFTDEEIEEVISKAYNKNNFKEKLVGLVDFDEFSFLTLYHGPTMAFKDMALTALPHLMEIALKKNQNLKRTYILTATSGDTGSAALSGFSTSADIKTIVLYPNNGVSVLQERQMHYYSVNGSKAIAVEGNFDDCQTLAKKAFLSITDEDINLASANSINIGRLIPQIVYYFYAYTHLVSLNRIKFGDLINISVPTGNFGNILASFLAKLMGLPVDHFICASNENNVLTDFFKTGVYDKNRPFYKTLSPSMDILVSSNLERYLYLISARNYYLVKSLMEGLKESGKYTIPEDLRLKMNDFYAEALNDEETRLSILDAYNHHNFLIDPHTSIAYGAYLRLKNKLNHYTLIASTASPFKFASAYYGLFPIEDDNLFASLKKLSKATNTPLDPKIKMFENVQVHKEILRIESETSAINYLRKCLGIHHE